MTVTQNDLLVGPVVPAAAVTLISIDFYFEAAADLEVYKSGSSSALTLGVDYTVSLPTAVGATDGSITLTVAANGVDSYSILGRQPLERSSDLQFRGDLRSPVINVELDRIWRALQAADTRASRAIRFSEVSNIPTPLNSESAAARGGKLLGFSADGAALSLVVGADNLIVPGVTSDNALVRWGGAAGAELQNSLVTVSDDGDMTINSTGFLQIPVGTTAQRPGAPAVGHMRANTSLGVLEVYIGAAWMPIANLSTAQEFAGVNTFGNRVDVANATEALLRFKAAADTTSLFQMAYDAAARAMLLAMRNAANDATVASIAFSSGGNIVIDADGLVNFTPTGELQYNGDKVLTEADAVTWAGYGPDATTGGTSQELTGLRSGLFMIDLLSDKVSLSGSSSLLVQVGTSADGWIVTGYQGFSNRDSAANVAATDGIPVTLGAGVLTWLGHMYFRRTPGTNKWTATQGGFTADSTERALSGGGRITLTSAVDRIRVISLNGTDTIDAGEISAWGL